MKPSKHIFDELLLLTTESRNPRSTNIDSIPVTAILRLMNSEDAGVSRAVKKEIPYIAKAVEKVVQAFERGGRLIYVGAGTSGRLGVLDAAECPPTFGVPPEMVQAVIAGGKRAVFRSVEGAEDVGNDGRRAMKKLRVGSDDVVCGIAASMRTPFVIAALQEAKKAGAVTLLITTNPRSTLRMLGEGVAIDVAICVNVGPEVITGSTRMKSGTAQKMVLNMLSTASMILIGKVYENLMVDVKLNSKKLTERAKRILITATGISYKESARALKRSGGSVKVGILMVLTGMTKARAIRELAHSKGFVRRAMSAKVR